MSAFDATFELRVLNEGLRAFSPDGRWLAYQSNECGEQGQLHLQFLRRDPPQTPARNEMIST